MSQTVSQAILFVFVFYIVSALIAITLLTLCIISLRAKIKFYKNMNRFIDENKERVSSIITDMQTKNS